MNFLVDMILWVAGLLPLRLRVTCGRMLGWVLLNGFRFRREVVAAHLRFAFPEDSPEQRERLLRAVYRHFGLLVFELLKLPSMSQEDVTAVCRLEGREHLAAALTKGKGAFALSGHMGNWELGLASAGAAGIPNYPVVKETRTSIGNHALKRLRQRHGVTPIPRHKAMHKILHTLSQNRVVVFVLDQNMTDSEGVFVDFFGKPACTMPGLALMAHRYGIPVVPVHCRREEDLRSHCLTCHPELAWEEVGPTFKDDIRHNTQRYTTCIEQMIRAQPDQWLWLHRRWRTRPATNTEDRSAGARPQAEAATPRETSSRDDCGGDGMT